MANIADLFYRHHFLSVCGGKCNTHPSSSVVISPGPKAFAIYPQSWQSDIFLSLVQKGII
jgi:hypothetical protein